MTERIRLHKFLAASGVASRRAAEKMIADGKVKVNGNVITTVGFSINPLADKIEVNGKIIQPKGSRQYYLLYKTAGTLTSVKDPHGRQTVIDLLPFKDVFPVGRLDLDTEGLLLLTDDGDLAYRLTHPRFKVKKKYLVLVKGKPGEEKLALLRSGIKLEEGFVSPALVQLLSTHGNKSSLHLTIHEGKKRQIKRMFAVIGHPVIFLKRIGYAFLTLQDLKPGEYRALTRAEVLRLKKMVGLKC